MLFTNLNLKPKTMKILCVLLTLTGILFILASNYIGYISLRIVLTLILFFYISNLKMTYNYLTTKEKTTNVLIIISVILGILKPQITMILIGVVLLFITIPPYINVIKNKDYSDVLMVLIHGLGILFASYCIINAKAALSTVIIILGILFVSAGCLMLFELHLIRQTSYKDDDLDTIEASYDEVNGFEDTSNL